MTPPNDLVRDTAARYGFDLVGVTSAEPLEEALRALEAWCAAGHAADMQWMRRDPPQRADPGTLLEGVRSVVSVAVNYWQDVPAEEDGPKGRVARYAWGLDYHEVVLPRLRTLADDLALQLGGRARAACDFSPVLERAAAVRAGLGFFGKNTCLLLPRRGSWCFLGEILLDVELPFDAEPADDHCGTCGQCLEDCPTAAFAQPYVLDARRCISYLTIEHKGAIERDLRPRMGAWVFGCDACQDVCPFNRFAEGPIWPELRPEAGVGPTLDLVDTLALRSDEAFLQRFAETPLLRPRRRGLLRNAAIAARNVGAAEAVPVLTACVEDDPEALVRAHALWALFGLERSRAATLAERALASDPDPLVRDEARAGLDGA